MRGMLPLFAAILLCAPPPTAKDLGAQAVDAWQKGRTAEALRLMKGAAELAPDDGSIRFALGVLALQTGDAPAALAAFERAVELMPEHFDARFNLGKLLVASGQPRAGLAHLRRAVKLRPKDPDVKLELAVALMASGSDDQARRQLETIAPRGAQVHSLLAFLALRQGDAGRALEHASAAASAEPGQLRHELMLTTTLLHAGQIDEARTRTKRLLRKAPPTQANVPYLLALADFLAGDAFGARRWMKEANARAPGAFDPSKSSFDPMGFPTVNDRAFLRWYNARPGNPAALEARIPELSVDGGKSCAVGPVMGALLLRAVQIQACFAPGDSTIHRLEGEIAGPDLVRLTGEPCLTGALDDAVLQLPKAARCKVRVGVQSARD